MSRGFFGERILNAVKSDLGKECTFQIAKSTKESYEKGNKIEQKGHK
jgi:hypothetical protein